MDSDEVNPYEKPTTRRTSVPVKSSLIERWLARCAATFPMYGKTLADYPEKFEAFKLALTGLKPEVMDFAFQQAIKKLFEFPMPAQILEFASQYGRPEFKPIELPERKQENYDPISLDEARQMFRDAVERLSVEKAMGAPGGRNLHESQPAAALTRLGGSTRPSDPAKLAEWASQMAVKNGWKPSREPGAEG